MAGALAPNEVAGRDVPQPIQTRIISDSDWIDALLVRLEQDRVPLWLDGPRVEAQMARLRGLTGSPLTLDSKDPLAPPEDEIQIRFELDGHRHYFSSTRLAFADGVLELHRPEVIHQEERRDRMRSSEAGPTADVAIDLGGQRLGGHLVDRSSRGLGLVVESTVSFASGDTVMVATGQPGPKFVEAEVRSVAPMRDAPGWRRIGLRLQDGSTPGRITVESAPTITWEQHEASDREPTASRLVRFRNGREEELSAIIDTWGGRTDGPVIVVPPAWGKTKETLLALSETIVSVFRAGNQPVTVVRFDGTHRKGTGHREPDATGRGRENVNYTFSRGVRDIHATLDFLDTEPELTPAGYVLVSFSVASVEARRAIVEDRSARIVGWISAVGASDPQALMRLLSGGVDYFALADRGQEIGLQNVQGMLLDLDNAGRDALANGMAFLEDARRDMSCIRVPVTWLHGRDDGWNQLERVREIMSCGDRSSRRVIELGTGHQLGSSREAADVFQLIAIEAARIATGEALAACRIDQQEVRRRRKAERQWSRPQEVDLRHFWRDYLVGESGHLGIELVTSMGDFQEFMDQQIRSLELEGGEAILDLGAGTGAFPIALAVRGNCTIPTSIVEMDLIPEALQRGRERVRVKGTHRHHEVVFVAADFSDERAAGIPVRSGAVDRVLASLLINYVTAPEGILAECFRMLRPGGRIVMSGMRRDADVSRICLSGLLELQGGRARKLLAAQGEERLSRSVRDFISSGGELLDLEGEGLFQFWDREELAQMLRDAGFEDVEVAAGYGSPPQATIVSGLRP